MPKIRLGGQSGGVPFLSGSERELKNWRLESGRHQLFEMAKTPGFW